MTRSVVALLVLLVALAVAQPARTPPGADTVANAEVIGAARDALQAAQRNFAKWVTIIVVAALAAAALVAWRMWVFGRRLARVDSLRNAWDTRFAETADEVLKLKKKFADVGGDITRIDRDVAAVRPAGLEAATAAAAAVQSDLAVLRERLQQAEEKLEAVGDHTVVTRRDCDAVGELVKSAELALAGTEASVDAARAAAQKAEHAAGRCERALATAETATDRAERATVARVDAAAQKAVQAARRCELALATAEVAAGLQEGDRLLATGEFARAAESYSRCVERLDSDLPDDEASRFHALHNRALASLRRSDFDAVLADTGGLASLSESRAKGAAGILAGAARLGRGELDAAIEEFKKAMAADEGARQVIAADGDILKLVAAGGRKAAPVKRFIKELSVRKPAARRSKRVPPRGRRRRQA